MNILLTGGAGFIGSRLDDTLEEAGHSVHVYDLAWWKDVRDESKLDREFRRTRFDMVIHLAALTGVGGGQAYPHDYISTNIGGTVNVVKCCERHGVGSLISFSSSSVLGEGLWKKETDAPKPVGVYGMTKLAGENVVSNSKIPNWAIVRPFTVYGPDGRGDMVIEKWMECVRRGEPLKVSSRDGKWAVRGFTHVDDLVDGVLLLVDSMASTIPARRVYHFGGSEVVRTKELGDMFIKHFGSRVKLETVLAPEWDVLESSADCSRAKEELGWTPKVKFEDGLEKIIEDYMINNMNGVQEFIRESNAIEGILGNAEADANMLSAWEWLKMKDKLTPEDVCGVQGRITAWQDDLQANYKGAFRDCPVWIGGKTAPNARKVRRMMEDWCEKWSTDDLPKVMDDVMDAHVEFEKAHPFADGNGRTGRLLAMWHMRKANLPLFIFRNATKFTEYYPLFK